MAAALVAAAGMAVSASTAVAEPPGHASVTSGATLLADRAELGQVRVLAASVQSAQDAAARLAAAKAAAAKAAADKAAADKAAADARAAAAAAASRALVRTSYGGSAGALGQQLAAARGWTGSQWVCLNNLWTSESNWRVTAHNSSTGAYGIPQALPGSKMGPGWQTNAETQISWGLSYIGSRYGSPCNAWSFFTNHNWY
ncbi:MAG TPA: lytic transglycosylase domain-containing protein [Actinomycetes bacterium]